MIDDKAPPNKRLRRGAVIRVQTDDKDNWRIVQMPEVEAAFPGRRSARRRDPRAGWRLRLQPQQVQPCHAGMAAAGIELQALHLFWRPGERLHARVDLQRRTDQFSRRR
jgi:hypothetical protein